MKNNKKYIGMCESASKINVTILQRRKINVSGKCRFKYVIHNSDGIYLSIFILYRLD